VDKGGGVSVKRFFEGRDTLTLVLSLGGRGKEYGEFSLKGRGRKKKGDS